MSSLFKYPLIFIMLLSILSFAHAQEYKIEINFIEKTFKQGEDITFKVILRDSENNILKEEVEIIIQDIDKEHTIEKTVNSNEIIVLNLDEKRKSGEWKVNAKKEEIKTTESFFIESKEDISAYIENSNLILENTGNAKINKEIQILIGDTKGEPKNLEIDIGEKEIFQLIAPQGEYEIKVISEDETLFSKSKVPLENSGFTGDAIGAINPDQKSDNFLTRGISPDADNRDAFLYFIKRNKIVYTFMLVIFGATILLAIERKYSAMSKINKK